MFGRQLRAAEHQRLEQHNNKGKRAPYRPRLVFIGRPSVVDELERVLIGFRPATWVVYAKRNDSKAIDLT